MPRKSAPVKASKKAQNPRKTRLRAADLVPSIGELRAACPVRFLGILDEQVSLWGLDRVTLCWYCRRPTRAYVFRPGETECDGCHEVTSRLSAFLRDGGAAARDVVQKALREAVDRSLTEDATEALTQALSSRDDGPSEGDELAQRVWDHGEDFEP